MKLPTPVTTLGKPTSANQVDKKRAIHVCITLGKSSYICLGKFNECTPPVAISWL